MPRDLAALMRGDDEPKDKISRDMEKQDHLAEIKPYVQTLTTSDIDSAVKLEDATFPPEERATREKVFVPPSMHFVPLLSSPQHVIWGCRLHLCPFLLESHLVSLSDHLKVTIQTHGSCKECTVLVFAMYGVDH
ncbi:hypothetical protein KCU83_g95, partial [Aureobasidium melanogenum]